MKNEQRITQIEFHKRMMGEKEQQFEEYKLRQSRQLENIQKGMVRETKSNRESYPKVSVAKYTGEEDLDDYLIQFEAVSKLHGWDEKAKSAVLISKLGGAALSAVTSAKAETFEEKVNCLKDNFSPEQRELSLQKLQVRRQKKDESFAVLAADIQRLAIKAYPGVHSGMHDTIATDHFVNSLSSSVVRQKLREKHPKDLSVAIKEARQIMADMETESMLTKRCSDRVHAVEESESDLKKLQDQVCLLEKSVKEGQTESSQVKFAPQSNGASKRTNQGRMRRNIPICYACNYKGHVQKWCPFLMRNEREPVPLKDGKPLTKPDLSKKPENLRG